MNMNTNLRVTPTGAGTAPPLASQPAPPAAAPTGDRFETSSQGDEAEQLRRAARELTRQPSLDKATAHYMPVAWTRDAGGTVYVGYSQSGKAPRSYLSAVDPAGKISWELDLGEAQVTNLGLAPDGSIQVGTLDGHLLCSTDGRLVEARTGGPAVRSHHQDSTGMHLEILSGGDTLRAMGPDGQEIPLPADLQGIRARTVRPTPEGGLIAFGGGKAVRLAPGGGTSATTPVPDWPAEGSTSYRAEGAWALRDGDVMVQRKASTFMRDPIGHGRDMMDVFPGGGGFGGSMRPGMPGPSYLVHTAMVRLAPDGTQRWKTGEFNDQTRFIPGPEGSILFNDGGREVRRVTPEGNLEKIMDLPERADIFREGTQPGSVLLRAGAQVMRLAPDGAVQGQVTLAPEQSAFQLEGDLQDGRILFRDPPQAVLVAFDPATGAWTRLTDPNGDHTLRAEDLSAPAPPEKVGKVEQGDGWVVIGDVMLPRG